MVRQIPAWHCRPEQLLRRISARDLGTATVLCQILAWHLGTSAVLHRISARQRPLSQVLRQILARGSGLSMELRQISVRGRDGLPEPAFPFIWKEREQGRRRKLDASSRY